MTHLEIQSAPERKQFFIRDIIWLILFSEIIAFILRMMRCVHKFRIIEYECSW